MAHFITQLVIVFDLYHRFLRSPFHEAFVLADAIRINAHFAHMKC